MEENEIDINNGSTEISKTESAEIITSGGEIVPVKVTISKITDRVEEAGTETITDDSAETDTEMVTGAATDIAINPDQGTKVMEAANEDSAETSGKSVDEGSDDFAEELAEMEHEAEDNEIIKNLSESINKQVELEIGGSLEAEGSDEPENPEEEPKEEKKGIIGFFFKIPKWIYITLGIAAFIVIIFTILDASGLGEKLLIKLGANVSSNLVDYQPLDPEGTELMPELVEEIDEEIKEQLTPIPTEEITPTPEPTDIPVEYEKKIINILLLGEENIGSYSKRGRTDMIVLATIDTITKTVKLTSLMRDSFVQIPGFDDNRINAAYALGGVPLMYSTIEKNFGIVPDNYILVKFDDFEKIVDSVGGIDITLSKREAQYLNKTNYISNPVFRTMVEGMNHMNGNQALGYSRVRYVAHDGEKNDFGRTTRHRVVISALIDRVKGLGYTDLVRVGLESLPLVTTDVTADEIERYTQMIIDIGGADINIEEMRVPIDGSYNFVTIRNMSVTQLDIAKNREALNEFIYGKASEEVTEVPTAEP